ncbi:CHASE2 domain-containing protein [Desulfonema magnum]|uniref:CHASE2 domain-containing protein n=1 Tax=Desulfonema magnum TaxID=45655 RepID=A0A975BMM6_9BACT|nr:CHASE2 domain-containing protein [Desulfonema magnum]QTA87978.1 CHASE2 domain-containing protein [Desulfonema magnum]
MGLFFNWYNRSPRERMKHFLLNLVWGVLAALLLHLISSYTGIGQEMLNDTYDFLVKSDFRVAVVSGEEEEPVSDAIRMIELDAETYEASPGQGFWTPRELLGRTIIKSIALGAKVVVVDFALDKPVPLYYEDGAFVEENQRYLSLLREAVRLAKKQGTAIILPWKERIPNPKGYTRQYYELLDQESMVIKQGSPAVFFNTSDRKVRHLRFYKIAEDQNRVLLSLPILAALYQWHGLEQGNKILAETEARLKKGLGDGISIPSDGSADDIQLYHQDPSKECLPARLKFRIAPREVMTGYGNGEDLLIDMMLTPAMLLGGKFDEKIYQDKTVLIGSTYDEIRDIHVTPIGDMPGFFVIANGLNLFLRGNQVHKHSVLKYLIVAMLIVLLAIIFVHMPLALAALLLTIVFWFSDMLISLWIFSTWGLFLDFWFLIVAIWIFENIVGLCEIAEDWLKTRRENE